jgi:hypothetical protein
MTNNKREKLRRRKEAARRGGVRSQEVQREKRMRGDGGGWVVGGGEVSGVGPRWSVGLRDNWQGEEGWVEFRSFRDLVRRFRVAMANLELGGGRGKRGGVGQD